MRLQFAIYISLITAYIHFLKFKVKWKEKVNVYEVFVAFASVVLFK